MSLLGGLNPVSLLATAALGPVGGIVAQLATQVLSQAGQQIIQQLGDKLGLPQSAIDMAQGSLALSSGDIQGGAANLDEAIDSLGQEMGAAPSDIGDAQRSTSDTLSDIVRDMSEGQDFKDAKASGGKGGGWLMAMAKVLGSQLDKLGDQMTDMASQITKDTPGLQAEFGVVSQQFGMLMNATNNAIKTAGEAMGKIASKN